MPWEMLGRLLPLAVELIREWVEAFDGPEDELEDHIQRNIKDMRAEVQRRRAARDAELAAKHRDDEG